MKNQDIGLLLKLIALGRRENDLPSSHASKGAMALPDDWRDWALDDAEPDLRWEHYFTVFSLKRRA